MNTSTKVALFDLDGLVITGVPYRFSIRLSKEYDIPMEKISEFFEKDFKECSFGRADLKEKIAPYLEKWGWNGSVESLLQYWFEAEGTVDQEVLAIVKQLRDKGISCYIATRQEKYRKNYLLEDLGLKNHFDGIFCTCDIGCDKWEPGFFIHILDELQLRPEEIMFFDDSEKNIVYAKSLGIQAYFYENIDTLKQATKEMLK